MAQRLLLATTNPGKLREYTELLKGLPFQVVTLKDVGMTFAVEETGATIRDNAILKAEAYSRLTGLLTIADDSGLEVDALDGEPGPRSARYAGQGVSDADRNAFLLAKVESVPDGRRQARFRCVIAIAGPGVPTSVAEGICEGVIAREPHGSNGFGYDPIFHLPDLGRRMAELSMEEKNRISHRAKAMAGAREALRRLTADEHR